jgi:hypothetical protein
MCQAIPSINTMLYPPKPHNSRFGDKKLNKTATKQNIATKHYKSMMALTTWKGCFCVAFCVSPCFAFCFLFCKKPPDFHKAVLCVSFMEERNDTTQPSQSSGLAKKEKEACVTPCVWIA